MSLLIYPKFGKDAILILMISIILYFKEQIVEGKRTIVIPKMTFTRNTIVSWLSILEQLLGLFKLIKYDYDSATSSHLKGITNISAWTYADGLPWCSVSHDWVEGRHKPRCLEFNHQTPTTSHFDFAAILQRLVMQWMPMMSRILLSHVYYTSKIWIRFMYKYLNIFCKSVELSWLVALLNFRLLTNRSNCFVKTEKENFFLLKKKKR